MKITIKLTKKEKELYKKSGTVVSLSSDDGGLRVFGYNWLDSYNGYAFGVKFRQELYKALKELKKP